MPIAVAIVEDDLSIREGIAFLIAHSPGFRCVAVCASAEDALHKLSAQAPDIVLMDIGLPGMSGIECISRLKASSPGAQIMMLTVFEDDERIFQSLAAGATGYLLKKTPPAKLLEAIKDLHEGGSPMSNQIARRVVEVFQRAPAASTPVVAISKREHEILICLAQGLLYKEIAATLGVSIHTVRTHLRNIYEKLHVRSRTEAVNAVYGTGAWAAKAPR